MLKEKIVEGKAQKLADIKARYEALIAKDEERGRQTATGIAYTQLINDVFEALDEPDTIKFSAIVDIYADDNDKDKKVVSTSIRTFLKSKASPFITEKDGKSLYIRRK